MAVFGVDCSCVAAPSDFRERGNVCLNGSAVWRAGAFHGVHDGDLVFIKAYTRQTGLDIKAVGIVRGELSRTGDCIPVEWVWAGERHLEDPDDRDPSRTMVLYEEYNLTVQRDILDLLPSGERQPLA